MTTINEDTFDTQFISGTGNELIVGPDGSIDIGGFSGGEPNAVAIDESGHDNTVVIKGVVWTVATQDTDGFGIRSVGADFRLTIAKDGFIRGEMPILATGANASIANSGSIQMDGIGPTSITMAGTGSTFHNLGDVTGRIDIGANCTVTNDGVIIGGATAGISGQNASAGVTIINHGFIKSTQGMPIFGSNFDDTLISDGRLSGGVGLGAGDDTADVRGGSGGKLGIFGAAGDDILITDRAKIQLVEGDSADSGFDTVKSTVTYSLTKNVEVLRLIGHANIDGIGTDNTVTREYLYGNDGNNSLLGLNGADVLAGKEGEDTLTGGLGADFFTLKKGYGKDTVIDFGLDETDRVFLDYDNLGDIKKIKDNLEQHGKDTWINMGHGDILVLRNVDHTQLVNDDFGW